MGPQGVALSGILFPTYPFPLPLIPPLGQSCQCSSLKLPQRQQLKQVEKIFGVQQQKQQDRQQQQQQLVRAAAVRGRLSQKLSTGRPQPLTVTPILLATVLNTQVNVVNITEWTALSSLLGRLQEEEPSCPSWVSVRVGMGPKTTGINLNACHLNTIYTCELYSVYFTLTYIEELWAFRTYFGILDV